jgi:hypothetical protein
MTARHMEMHVGLFDSTRIGLERILLAAVEPPFLGKRPRSRLYVSYPPDLNRRTSRSTFQGLSLEFDEGYPGRPRRPSSNCSETSLLVLESKVTWS